MESSFYVAQVMTGTEERFIQLAQGALDRFHLDDTHVLWPRRKLTIRRKGRRLPSLAPLFPGYVIVQTPEIERNRLTALRRSSGFVRLLPETAEPHCLTGNDLEVIQHVLSFGEVVQQSRVTFDVNHRIVVQDGPLRGLEGQIVKVDRRKRRAKVRLDLYKNTFLVDLGFEIIGSDDRPAPEQSGDGDS